jgi:TonB-linked SusC/RagA family outer membrane protein
MKKNLFLTLLACVLTVACLLAQRTVTGVVTDPGGEPLIGVNVVEAGTSNGTISDFDGRFELRLQGDNPVLEFSMVGFSTQRVTVGAQTNFNIVMEEGIRLGEVVVTALGVSREKKSLGYAVTEVSGDELVEARENSVVRQLSGKVAGVTVVNAATGPAGSSRVIIRGNASLAGNNQPLYVIDGVPIDNTNLGSAGMWGGIDLGDGLSSINPDDIESMSVLKGPAATALYGTRAQNGVIMITTKKGVRRKGIGVEVNSNFVLESPLDFYNDVQLLYGAGTQGVRPETQQQAINTTRSSWGERLDGRQTIQFDGSTAPYSANPSAINQLYNNGRTLTNTVALTGGGDNSSFRFSISDLRNNGMFENTGYNRNTYNLRGATDLARIVALDARVTYINERANNRPALSDSPHNPGHLNEVATSVNLDLLRKVDPITGEYNPLYSPSQFRVNPFFGVYQQRNEDTRDRLQGLVAATINFTDWLSLLLRGGTDFYTFRQTQWDGERTPHLGRPGRIWEREWRVRENNYDFLLQSNHQVGGDWTVGLNLGGAQLQQNREQLGLFGEEFIIYGLRTMANTAFPGREYSFFEKKVNSVYGASQIAYKNFLFFDVTARNDWSSTLPANNNSYFYPSAATSFVFTDAFDMSSGILSFGKVRLSWAQVGGDTDPYQLDLTYTVVGQPHLGNPQGQIAQGRIPQSALRPTRTSSYEAGLDLRFFNGRLGLDLAWYNMNTRDQILSTDISPTSGYGSVTVNAGEIVNRGIELLLTANPVRTQSGFSWDFGLNFARNRNEVKALDDEGRLSFLRLEESRARNAFVEARLGEPYGAIVGRAYRKDAQGRFVYDAQGRPLPDPAFQILGIGVPDLVGGLNNNITFKGISFGALLDFRFGGQLHSMTNLSLMRDGRHINTLDKGMLHPDANHPSQRDEDSRAGWIRSEQERLAAGVDPANWQPTGGVFVSGVNTEGQPFSRFVDPQIYYGWIAGNIAEEFIYSADFIKMRQMTLSYTLPQKLIQRSPFQNVMLSLVGRNLFFLHRKVPNIDPEAVYASGNGQGLEYATIPTARSYGFNLALRF